MALPSGQKPGLGYLIPGSSPNESVELATVAYRDPAFFPEVNDTDVNATTPCSNEYCVSDEDYVDMIEKYIFPDAFEWVLIVLYFYVFAVGLVGNFLVCFAVLRNRHMRTVTNFFIVNLATADFMVILICLPPTVLEDVTETWYMGKVMCKIVKYLQGVSVSVSVLTLTAISIERYFAICSPLKFRSTTNRARFIICVIWLVSILIIFPELYAMDTLPLVPVHVTSLLTSCQPRWDDKNQMAYQLFQLAALYLLPFCVMGVAYAMIASVLWSNNIPTETTQKCSNSANGKAGKTQMENQIIARRKVAKMLIAVVVMFGVCYLPVHLLNVLRYANTGPTGQASTYFALIAHWLCYFNSAINPIIYNFMSAKFRLEFNAACRCRGQKKTFDGSMYSYVYTNDNTQTEHVTMATIAPPGGRKAGSDSAEKSWD